MEGMRISWAGDRLDHLNYKVDALSVRVDALSVRVDELSRRMDDGFKELRGELSALQRTMIVALVALFASQIGLIVAQL
jgi:hypothetical protein